VIRRYCATWRSSLAWLFCLLLVSSATNAQTSVTPAAGAAPEEMQAWAGGIESGGRSLGDVQLGGSKTGDLGTGPRISGSYVGPGRSGRAPLTMAGAGGGRQAAGVAGPNEFQKFVAEATGSSLPIYGTEFFSAANGYAPVQGVPVPGDHLLGPGDELLIRGWGSVDLDFRAVIDRDGLINIPKVGTVPLSGVRAANVEDVLRAAIGKVYRGFTLNVTYGQLRGITIYVVGQAQRPGTYTVSSLSTLITALFESGGPSRNGSLRRVQVKRAGKLVSEMDLYSFLARGDKAGDVKLIDGDVIVIPPASGYVALLGKVEAPAIFELRGNEDTIESLLNVAGGLPVVADPRRVLIEHLDPGVKQPRTVEDLQLDAAGLKKTLKSGDLVSVLPIKPEFANVVSLRIKNGNAFRMSFRTGMKITDLIPDKESLISRAAVLRQNNLGRALGDQYDEFNWDYAVVERLNRADLTVSLVAFDLGRALADPAGPDNLPLQIGDTVTVFPADDVRVPISKRRVFVRIEGEVKRPGVYQVKPGESLVNLVLNAGGITPDAYLFGTEFSRDSVRRAQQENLDKLIRRFEQQAMSETNRVVANAPTLQSSVATAQVESRTRFLQGLRELKSTGRMSLGIVSADTSVAQWPDIRLENGDHLVVPSRPDFVQVSGAVDAEASFLWMPGRTVSDYLAQAGVTRDADKDATFVIRANGSVLSNSDRWLSSVAGLEALPGDVVVIPEKLDKETFWNAFTRNAKDITQILYQFGIGAAALKTLK